MLKSTVTVLPTAGCVYPDVPFVGSMEESLFAELIFVNVYPAIVYVPSA